MKEAEGIARERTSVGRAWGEQNAGGEGKPATKMMHENEIEGMSGQIVEVGNEDWSRERMGVRKRGEENEMRHEVMRGIQRLMVAEDECGDEKYQC